MSGIRAKGSFTIEASLIMSLVIMCLLYFIYCGFYLHDKVILDGVADLAAQRGRLLVVEDQDPWTGYIDWNSFWKKGILWRITGVDKKSEVKEYLDDLMEDQLLVCKEPVFDVSTGNDSVTVTYHAETKLRGMYPFSVLFDVKEINGCVKSDGMEAEEFVRMIKAISEGGE